MSQREDTRRNSAPSLVNLPGWCLLGPHARCSILLQKSPLHKRGDLWAFVDGCLRCRCYCGPPARPSTAPSASFANRQQVRCRPTPFFIVGTSAVNFTRSLAKNKKHHLVGRPGMIGRRLPRSLIATPWAPFCFDFFPRFRDDRLH